MNSSKQYYRLCVQEQAHQRKTKGDIANIALKNINNKQVILTGGKK